MSALIERLWALWAEFRLERVAPRFIACLESDAREGLLERLFRVMSLTLLADRRCRQSIAAYDVSYVFQREDGSAQLAVIFAGGRMRILADVIAEPDVTVTFKDNEALARFLFNDRLDLIGSIVNNEISYVGNLNYLRKLAYMAKHLQLRFASAVKPAERDPGVWSIHTLSRSNPSDMRSACHCGSIRRKYS
ncbi:SCP2 sterol-binding domain-containing protein [Enhygromyxa salina]|uniref:SCP2 domain-containing protein n=1 Tax=Enhygromyxa salina TaxID=215803 RepID=A0A2S9XTD3_9BACT|nr:SCP2 sterol-binding domain-containing protein [Enhygromyxa salina]PRP96128.1 hypothetical protein ENSA7_69420 [Enhygromyxa salina]